MNEPLDQVIGTAVALPDADIDTDIIFPARFLLITERRGLGQYAFHDRRAADPEFPLNQPENLGVPILVAGSNFGCGSSREQALWALAGIGIRVIIAPSFGEIFFANAFRNGMLPIVLPTAQVLALHDAAKAGERFTVDLTAGRVAIPGAAFPFTVAEDQRQALLHGWDETARIQALNGAAIARFETQQRKSQPWLWNKECHD
jgi:3-isopropylmalate dehydratase small subunit